MPDETSKGVEVMDIISQLRASQSIPGIQRLLVHIDSPGGLCDVGHAISECLDSCGLPYDTTTTNQCCSMGTRIFVGGQNREIVKPCTFLVHNPWGSVEGDADQLMSAGEIMKQEEDKLINIYHKVTNNEKAILDILMKQDTPMSEEKALELGFATKVTGAQVVAVAYLPKSKQVKTPEMDNKKKVETVGVIASLKALANQILGIDPPKGMMVTDSNGMALELWNPDQSPATEVKTGLMVTAEGQPAPDGTYQLAEQAVTITVTSGVISDVQPIQAAAPEPTQARIEELEKALAEANAKLAESDKNTQDVIKEVAELKETLTAVAKLRGTHTPPNGQTRFNKDEKTKPLSLKEQFAQRDEQTKKK